MSEDSQLEDLPREQPQRKRAGVLVSLALLSLPLIYLFLVPPGLFVALNLNLVSTSTLEDGWLSPLFQPLEFLYEKVPFYKSYINATREMILQ